MQHTIEVELKFHIIDSEKLLAFLAPYAPTKKAHTQIDIYHDTPQGALFKRGIFMRTRNGKQVDIKFNREDVFENASIGVKKGHCEEYTFPFPFDPSTQTSFAKLTQSLDLKQSANLNFQDFLRENNFDFEVPIQKTRQTYQLTPEILLCMDRVENLSTFIEIETLVHTPEEVAPALTKLKNILPAQLTSSPLTTGYVSLMWRKLNFEVYMHGKYLATEDLKVERPTK